MPFQFTSGAAVIRILRAIQPISGFARRTVVALEVGEGVFCESQSLEFGKNFADTIVNGTEHRRHNLSIPRQIREPIHIFLRGVHRIVRCIVRDIEEKGFAQFNRLSDISDGVFSDKFSEVFTVSINLFAVFPKVMCLVDAGLSQPPVEDV